MSAENGKRAAESCSIVAAAMGGAWLWARPRSRRQTLNAVPTVRLKPIRPSSSSQDGIILRELLEQSGGGAVSASHHQSAQLTPALFDAQKNNDNID
jgi:hypothetical protein